MRVNSQTAVPNKPTAANNKAAQARRQQATNPQAANKPARSARANAQRGAQNARRATNQAANRPQQNGSKKPANIAAAKKGSSSQNLSKTAMNKKNAMSAKQNTQAASDNKKTFEAYQARLTELIKKRDQNGDMKLSIKETGATKADFAKMDLNKDGFISKTEVEARVSTRIDAMEEILLTDPGKLVKMMKDLGPGIVDKVGGKDSYKKIVKNLKILDANHKNKNPEAAKSKGNVSFMA
ncbi:MAG: hypothetical protein GY714_23900 [Desulfobacterales bacterium]|nr:hypothetical protein [Desulfobacterales bacterium]MCP4160917.1 hypothetical protein [Deltaproteobacteria bacterium]